jgi:hypothetical protein
MICLNRADVNTVASLDLFDRRKICGGNSSNARAPRDQPDRPIRRSVAAGLPNRLVFGADNMYSRLTM